LKDDRQRTAQGEDDEKCKRTLEKPSPPCSIRKPQEKESDGQFDKAIGEDDQDGVNVHVLEVRWVIGLVEGLDVLAHP